MIYFIIKTILQVYFFWVLNVNERGLNFIPEKGPAIIAANHPGLLDGLLVSVVLKRRIYAFAKAEIFNSRFKMWLLKAGGGIPVGSEEINKNALIKAEQLLRKNKLLLVFPEGRINTEPDLLPFKNGFLRLAVKCGVPVVPVSIAGSEKSLKSGQFFPRPANIFIRFLEPLRFNSINTDQNGHFKKNELQGYIEKVRNKIQDKFNFLKGIYIRRLK